MVARTSSTAEAMQQSLHRSVSQVASYHSNTEQENGRDLDRSTLADWVGRAAFNVDKDAVRDGTI